MLISPDYDWYFNPRQLLARELIWLKGIGRAFEKPFRLLVGGAKGGGKSVFVVRFVYEYADWVIKKLRLQPQKYPIPVAWMGRQQSVDFTDTTLETWFRFIPEELYTLRPAAKEIIIRDTVKIAYGGMDSKKAVQKFQSAEYGLIAVDQAEEITLDQAGLLQGTLRRKIGDYALPPIMLLSCNPAECWLRSTFVENESKAKGQRKESSRYIKFLPRDNNMLPSGYIPNLKEAFRHRPELLAAYLDGRWDLIAGFDSFIRYGDVISAAERGEPWNNPDWRVTSADIARFGDDETVIINWVGRWQKEMKIIQKCDHLKAAAVVSQMMTKNDSMRAYIEEDPFGAPVIVELRQMGKQVLGINPGEKARDEKKYVNVRAEMWDLAGWRFANGEVSILEDVGLREQLTSTRYSFGSKERMKAELKEKVKERSSLGLDRGDSTVIGLYGMEISEPQKKREERTPAWARGRAGRGVDFSKV